MHFQDHAHAQLAYRYTPSIDTNGWVVIVRDTLYERFSMSCDHRIERCGLGDYGPGAVHCCSELANVDVVYMKLRDFTGHRSHFDLSVPYA